MSEKSKGSGKADKLRKIREENAKPDAKEGKIIPAETAIPVLSEEQKRKKAIEEDRKFRELEESSRGSFVEMMVITRNFVVYELFKYLDSAKTGKPFHSFHQWLHEAAPYSHQTGYAALKAGEKILPLIPPKELKGLPRYSFEILSKVPRSKIVKLLPHAKRAKSRKELVKKVKKHAPEAHVEDRTQLKVDKSVRAKFEQAVNVFMELNQCSSQDAIDGIAAHYLNSSCEDERFQGMSNEQAFEVLEKQKDYTPEKTPGEPSASAAD